MRPRAGVSIAATLPGWGPAVRRLALFLLALAPACQDSPAGPIRVASVVLSQAPDRALQVGETVSLAVSLLDAAGRSLAGRPVEWTSLAPDVATVSRTGQVTGLAPGEAAIVAASEGVSDTFTVVVAQPAATGASCADQPTLALAAGESQALPAGTGLLCVAGAGTEYLLVAFNGRPSGSTALQITAIGVQLPAAGAAPFSPSVSFALTGGADEPAPDEAFERGLRERERAGMARYLPGARAAAQATSVRPSLSAMGAALPAVGDLVDLNTSTSGCTVRDVRVGRVAAVSDRAIILSDTGNPAGGFSDAEYREIGRTFDSLVHDVVVGSFGTPTDLDGNGRVLIFYTRAVNELTRRGSESYVGGYFYARDLFPRTAQGEFEGCPASNHAEIFYVLAPDPAGEVNGNVRSRDFVAQATVSTLAHELQHLINASRRIYVSDSSSLEEVWLEEGLSHMAEELVFYRAAGLTPGQKLTAERLRSNEVVREAFNRFAAHNFGRLREHLAAPESSSPFANNDQLSTRGAAWAFLRYAADRKGGDQTALWRSLSGSKSSGFANLRAAFGAEPAELARDWAAALYLDDVLPGVPSIYRQPSWSYRSIYSLFGSPAGVYPLAVRTLTDGAARSLALTAGGSSFSRYAVGPGGVAEIRLDSGGAAPPPTLSLLLVRTR